MPRHSVVRSLNVQSWTCFLGMMDDTNTSLVWWSFVRLLHAHVSGSSSSSCMLKLEYTYVVLHLKWGRIQNPGLEMWCQIMSQHAFQRVVDCQYYNINHFCCHRLEIKALYLHLWFFLVNTFFYTFKCYFAKMLLSRCYMFTTYCETVSQYNMSILLPNTTFSSRLTLFIHKHVPSHMLLYAWFLQSYHQRALWLQAYIPA